MSGASCGPCSPSKRLLCRLPVSGGLPDDSGAIVRYIVSPDLQVVSSQVLVAAGANRPHTLLVGNLLVTTWDQGGSGGSQAWLWMDQVNP